MLSYSRLGISYHIICYYIVGYVYGIELNDPELAMRLTQVWYAKVYVYQVNICGNLWLSEQEKERNEMEKEERKRPLVFLLGDFEECKDQDTKVKLACAVMTEFTSDPGYNLDYLWPEEKQSIMVARRIWLEHRVFG